MLTSVNNNDLLLCRLSTTLSSSLACQNSYPVHHNVSNSLLFSIIIFHQNPVFYSLESWVLSLESFTGLKTTQNWLFSSHLFFKQSWTKVKMKKWSSQWTQFMQLRKEAWKTFRTSTGFEPVTSQYRCDALPTELWSNWRWEQVNFGFICSGERNEC